MHHIDKLPKLQRAVVMLSSWRMAYAEIAAILDRSSHGSASNSIEDSQ